MNDVLINGVTADYLSVYDRAIHYGDGIFETILCSNNRLFYWHQHYQRLKESAVKLPNGVIQLDTNSASFIFSANSSTAVWLSL